MSLDNDNHVETVVTLSHKITNSSTKSDKNENGSSTESVGNNSAIVSLNAEKKVVTRGSEIFYNNYLLKTSNDKAYVIDGIEVSCEKVDTVRSVLPNAVSLLLGGKLYYDCKG